MRAAYIASSAGLAAATTGPLTPMQIRLSYAGPEGMTVGWNTYDKLDEPTVYWGP